MFTSLVVDFLSRSEDFRVVGTAFNGAEALRKVAELEPDIVLLDLQMPGMGGMELMLELRNAGLSPKVVVCTGVDTAPACEALLALGVTSFLSKSASLETLLATLRSVAQGRTCMTPRMAESLRELVRTRRSKRQLSSTDLSILRLLGQDQTPKEIAAALGMTVSGVYKIRRRISARTGARRAGEFRAAAARLGLDGPSAPQTVVGFDVRAVGRPEPDANCQGL
jgi:DNA-binding NarL/FixJ family response regulator